MGYLAVILTCWLTASAASKFSGDLAESEQEPGLAASDTRQIYWSALNRNSY
jgi:hypothetical protein